MTFVVSGMLWQRSLVMMDLETRSLWSHILGRAMGGTLKGEELTVLPSVMTDWKTWRAEHPETTVLKLSRTSQEYRREFYREPSKFAIGMAEGGAARAWPFDQLVRQPVVNDQFDQAPVLVVLIQDRATAVVYNRQLDGRTLTFSNQDGKLVDEHPMESGKRQGACRTAGRQATYPTDRRRLVSPCVARFSPGEYLLESNPLRRCSRSLQAPLLS